MRDLILYVWVCRYFDFLETLNLFHRHFTKLVTRMEDVASYGLSAVEQAAFPHFESEVGTVVIEGGEEVEA